MTDLPTDALIAATRATHEEIRAGVAERLAAARRDRDLAARPGAEGAGDISYALDDVAEAPLARYVDALSAIGPATLIAEGPGTTSRDAPDGPPLRAITDPIDGTRPLMHDMRSAWVLTGVARDRGEATRLSDVQVAVQTELPTTSAALYEVIVAVRGLGATRERRRVDDGELVDVAPLEVVASLPPDNGFYSVSRFLPPDRALAAAIEREVFERAIARRLVEPRLMYEDQWLCTAGQLHALATGRYRWLADLRGWYADAFGVENFTSKPYDLATLLAFEEAGVVVCDADFRPLDAPLDTSTPLSVVAFGNQGLHDVWAPLLRAAMAAVRGAS